MIMIRITTALSGSCRITGFHSQVPSLSTECFIERKEELMAMLFVIKTSLLSKINEI